MASLVGGLEVDQVAVEAVELDVPIRHLLVDGRQLFVGRLQLFLRRLQFLVDALQLFVGGLDFLVGRLEFLVGRFVLLLHGLEVIAGFGQIAFEFGETARLLLCAQWRRGRLRGALGERAAARPDFSASSNKIRKQRSRKFFSGMTSMLIVRVTPFVLDPHVLRAHGLVLLLGLVDGGAQRQHQPFARHLQHVEARLAGRRLQIGPGRPAELQDLQFVIDRARPAERTG